MPLNRGDALNIMMSGETEDEGLGIEAIEPDGEPAIPSIIVTIPSTGLDIQPDVSLFKIYNKIQLYLFL